MLEPVRFDGNVTVQLRPLSLHTQILGCALLLAAALAGCEDQTIGQLSVTGKFDPNTLDFGDVPVGMSRTLSASLKNTGTPIFSIDSVEVPQSFTLPGLKASLMGKEIEPGGMMGLDVAFLSMAEGEVTGDLVIISGTTRVTLKVRANGVQLRVPVLSLEPAALDFGSVEVGSEQRLNARIHNMGNATGVIERVELASGTMEFKLEGPTVFEIAEGTSRDVTIVFTPSVQGPRNDRMTFAPAGGFAALELSLTGNGVIPAGEILCSPTTINFGSVERGLSSTQSVTCTARGGAVRLISANIGSGDPYFRVVNPPQTTDLAVDQSATINVEYTPDGLPMGHTSVLLVQYAGATSGTAMVQLIGDVVPPPPTATAISVVLRWNTNNTDIDLHLVRPNGVEFEDTDCYYANPSPDWGTPNDMSDNPYLDVDDVNGQGPETINLSASPAGDYRIMIHYFADNLLGNSNASVDVYIAGTLAGTFNRNLSCDDLWTVGIVSWNGTGGTFTPSNNVRANSNHGVCL